MISRRDLDDLPATLTVEEAAELLGLGRRTAYRAIHDGTIPHLRLGERRIVVPTDRLLREVLGHQPGEGGEP